MVMVRGSNCVCGDVGVGALPALDVDVAVCVVSRLCVGMWLC